MELGLTELQRFIDISLKRNYPKIKKLNLKTDRQPETRMLECSFSELDIRTKRTDIDSFLRWKRRIDIITAAALLVVTTPLMLIIVALVKLGSHGPAIYSQKRLTHEGRIFTMFKFRTMFTDAEHGSGPQWATENDPRITILGRWLRKLRLDELPQLYNVLRGDMSLIGPRPERPELAAKIKNEVPGFGMRLRVPAGITGLAQVSAGYAEDSMDHATKLALDLAYIKHCSLKMDLQITLATIKVVLTGFGAR